MYLSLSDDATVNIYIEKHNSHGSVHFINIHNFENTQSMDNAPEQLKEETNSTIQEKASFSVEKIQKIFPTLVVRKRYIGRS